MRLLFLSFFGLASVVCRAMPPDSIWVRIGPSAAVLFYGDKKNDLQKLQVYDWNAILRDLNNRLAEVTPADPNQRFIDLTGKSYLSDTSIRSANSVLKVTQYQKDTPVSIERVGKTAELLLSAISVRAGLTTFALFTPSNSQWDDTMYHSVLNRSYNLAIGSTPYIPLARRRRWSFGIRTGLEVDWKRYKWWAIYYRDVQTTFLAIQAPVIPTFRFYKENGLRTWTLGLGGYVGGRLTTRERAYTAAMQEVTSTLDPNNSLLYGINMNVGYGKWGVYTHYELGSKRETVFSRKDPNAYFFLPVAGKSLRSFSFGLTYNGL